MFLDLDDVLQVTHTSYFRFLIWSQRAPSVQMPLQSVFPKCSIAKWTASKRSLGGRSDLFGNHDSVVIAIKRALSAAPSTLAIPIVTLRCDAPHRDAVNESICKFSLIPNSIPSRT
jgi:hypothetical protein